MKRFLLGFYCGGAAMMFAVALSFGATFDRALLSSAVWPYYVADVLITVSSL